MINVIILIVIIMVINSSYAAPKRPLTSYITSNTKEVKVPRLARLDSVIPGDAFGKIMSFSSYPFRDVFEFIRGKKFQEGDSMMHRGDDMFPALKYHDAIQDDNFALRNWFDLESCQEKLDQLRLLLMNPTVDFLIEDKYVLQQASEFGDLEVIKKLVERGVTPSPEAVVEASKFGHKHLVNYYLDYPYWDRAKLLFVAAKNGQLEMVTSLIEDQEYVEKISEDEWVEIFENAIQSGNLDIVKLTEQYLPRIEENETNDEEHSFLPEVSEEAAIGGSIALVEYLHSKDLLNVNGALFLYHTAKVGTKEFFALVLESFNIDPNEDMVFAAIHGGNYKVFKFFEEQGLADFQNEERYDLLNAFSLACIQGSLEFIQYLINKFDITPDSQSLENAAVGGNLDVAKYLIERYPLQLERNRVRQVYKVGLGWKSDQKYYDFLNFISTRFNYTYDISDLKWAIKSYHISFAKYLLIEKQIIPDQRFFQSVRTDVSTHLMCYLIKKYGFSTDAEGLKKAAYRKKMDYMIFLINQGITPDTSVLNKAIESKADYIVRYLIEKQNVAPNYSSLVLAAIMGSRKLVQDFTDMGFKPDDQVMKAAVLRQAILYDNLDVINYLVNVDNSLKPSQKRWELEFSSKTDYQLYNLAKSFSQEISDNYIAFF